MFFDRMPGDWLLSQLLRTLVCRLDDSAKKCNEAAGQISIDYRPSLFQHAGLHSSLKGKLQKLKDSAFK